MPPLSLTERIAARLATAPRDPATWVPPADDQRRAAVAAILHGDRVLCMRRAEREGDPWSGHISLPGGGYHETDGDLRTTAVRETREELGVDLDAIGARFVGALAPLHPRQTGPRGIEVSPFVFAVDAAPAVVVGPEAIGGFWLPLPVAASGALDGSYTYPGSAIAFPSWTFEGHVIWGLTYRILTLLIEAAA